MATLSRAESKHMYSWWWNSHISPKNSKWLQENLTDMDSKVKNMIKLIEVDEDSFARRAEMYYKKRPELMKLVEEFYRAYRALAERYDHATGVIRHAHRTMAEVFPDQVQGMGSDENDSEPRTPDMSLSARPSCDPDELPKGAIGISHSDKVLRNRDAAFTHESETTAGQNGESSISDNQGETRARRSLNFHNSEKNDSMAESERMGRYETDVMALKEALSKLEAEKEAGLLQFRQSLQKLSDLEAELKCVQDDSKSLLERAVNAEAQVQTLKESLAKLEGEREANLHQYQKCVEKISGLEANITHAQEDVERQDKRACQSEQEAQVLREELSHLRSEKESSLAKYMEALEKIANLGNQLLLAEDKAEAANERADKAEKEVEALTKDVESLSKESKALAIEYEQCLSKIASLEAEIALVKEEAERLKHERDEGAAKLKGAEEQCHVLERSNMSMKSELDTLSHKLGMQNEELSEKQRELGRLWTCVQEERLRFVEVETAFRTLQGLHSQNQEELRSVASELQKRVQLLKEMEIQNQSLQDEVQKVRDENTGLNLSSAASIKNLQDEISNLQTGKCQLVGELEHRLDQRNALQQEIYCLKEELKDLNKKHHAVMEQVESVGFLPECIGSSIRDLREENSGLKESCQSSEAEISALLEKLTSMEKLVENNALLEKSLSELGSELENARAKVKALEESCQLLVDEKSSAVAEKATLISQLEITTQNLEKLSERNTLLENSLFDANAELEALRASSKKLEESCLLLGDEKSVLVSEKQALEMKLESAQKQLEDLGTRHKELEQNYSGMKDERESALRLLEELRTSLATEKQERSTASQLSGQQIAKMENQIRSLQKVGKKTREELEGELDNAMNAQLEIFILKNSLHDMREKNSALLLKCEKILETSKLSEKLISELEYENIEQQDEVNFLSDQIKRLRMGMVQLLKALEVDLDCAYDEKHLDDDQLLLHRILVKLDDTKSSLYEAWDENQKLVIEKSVLITLLGQLKQEVADLKTLIITVQQEFRIGNDQLSSLQSDMKRLLQSNEELILSVREGNHKENLLAAEVESLRAKVLQMQGVCKDLETENGRVQEEKKSLTKQVLYLDEEKNKLELENSNLVMEAVSLGNLSVILQCTTEQSWAVTDQLNSDIDRLWSYNWALEEKIKIVENKLDEAQMEKSSLESSLKTCEYELEEVTVANSQLKKELSLKEMELLQVESVKDDEQKQKLDLSEKYNQLLKEMELIHQSVNDLDAELFRIKEEREDARKRVEMMGFELQKGKDEAELWETEAGTFFTELQATAVREALVNEKLSEPSREYVSLQDENSRVHAQLAGYIPALACITDSVASLENHAAPTLFEHIDGQEKKGAGSGQRPNEDDVITANGFSELNDVAMRIKAIETSVIEMKKLSDEQNSQTSSKLDAATREIETLRSQQLSRSHRGGSSRSSRRYSPEIIEAEGSQNGHINHQQKQARRTDSFEASGGGDMMMMKDIVLDQVSSATSSRGRNMKGDNDRDDRNLELWETMDQGGGSINLGVGRTSHYKAASIPSQNQQQFDAVKEHHKNRPPSSESLGGKEINCVDKLDISSRFPEFLEPETKKKVLERLVSDIQKLTNLQITVQDLKEKVETSENNSNMKGNKGGAVEYVGVKEQLGEAESTISKLLETNEKLVKKVESSSLHMSSYSDVSSTSSMMDTTSEIGASSRRRGRVSEQARRCSEKIGRLQLEVQKIQFLLLKLDGAGSNRTSTGRGGGTRVGERNTRVLLRDYLYGGPRTPRRRMKSRFCGCVRPPTSGGD